MTILKKYGLRFIVIIILGFMTWALILSAKNNAQTVDEGVYISSGYALYQYKQYPLNKEHPPLAKYLAGLPLQFQAINFTDNAKKNIANNDQYGFANEFLYNSGNNADKIIFFGRLPFIILTITLGLIIFWFIKNVTHSEFAGLISIAFYAICPNIIANGHLATNDFLLTFFFVLIALALYFYAKKPTKQWIVAIGFCAAGAILSKFSALILFLIIPFLFAIYVYLKKITLKQAMIDLSIILAIILGIVLLIYNHNIIFFFQGIAIQFTRTGSPAYLFGQYSETGWWYYFPLAFLIKTPLPTILLLVITLICISIRWQKTINYLPLLILPIIFFLVSCFNKLDLGIRYILPIFPFIYLGFGLVFFCVIKQFKKYYYAIITIIFFSILINFFSFYKITPYQIAYFNELVGGPDNGYKYLVDSNLDWGQGLKELASYLKENNINEPIYLSYFGTASPKYYGINFKNLPYNRSQNISGYVVISVNNLILPFGNFQNFPYDVNVFKWLLNEQPITRIGHSIYIYKK